MITIDLLNNAEEQELLSIAKQHGQNAGQLIASIVREYLEDLHDGKRAEAAMADIESGKSELLDWDDVKAGLYQNTGDDIRLFLMEAAETGNTKDFIHTLNTAARAKDA